ncbi:uncharacterized protein LOC129570238 isoform X2 [Sitodiplosis mosellana]|uniref:uncharacterized protein LOC129570238 isoform X2 n=1 Tax=Sitodiplosis mosellana TaxID=263140 RepID=UPI002444A2DF|nr:uncharacterized protein LOC129570238 isoform X2 [Sitodiplosis mosellana]
MGGLMNWLKKDGSKRTRRRESAPLQMFAKQKPTSEEKLRNSLIRFTQFREHQRIERLSMGANEVAAYHTISGDAPNYTDGNTTPTEQNHVAYQPPSTCPPKPYRSQGIPENRNESTQPPYNGRRTKKISVQFHLGEGTDDSDMTLNHRNSRHSMPAIVTNAYVRGMRRTQNSIDSRTIREEAIEEFEEEHCMYNSDSVNDDQTSYRSPPMKFYKQNLNPYPSNSETSSLSTLAEALPIRGTCPEKPKRLLLNSKQSRKLLTEAHFTGAYRNFEIKSPYYSDSSSVFSAVEKQNHATTDTGSGLNGDNASQLDHYQVVVNKHGDEVEYALPCIDLPQYQRRQQLTDCFKSDDSTLADEVFDTDPKEFVRILSENFEMASNTSHSVHEEELMQGEYHRTNGKVMITDLDKSIDSAHTFDDLETVSRAERINEANSQMRTPNRVLQFHETMQCADIICLISEFNSMGRMEVQIETPLHFEWGTFKNAKVTVRKYADLSNDDEANKDFALIAETAIIRDAEVLRKIRHPNIINLMAIAFEPFKRLALIMEPTRHSLNHHLFAKNEQLDLIEVVTVVKRIAGAISYMQEFGISHSNISSHAILVGNTVTQVKLTSFELAVPYKSDIQDEVDLKSKQKTKRVPSIRPKRSPKQSLSSEQKIERYKQLTSQVVFNEDGLESTYTVPFIREISTKYFPYSTEYRRKLAIFNYQPPELLSQDEQFVFPTKQSDTYALTLLLWELLNKCIPFVIYDETKLDELLKSNYPLKYLPIVEEERCQRFHEILERGLKREPATRIDLAKMIRKLEAIETEILRGNENDHGTMKCCCLKSQKSKATQRQQPSVQENTLKDDTTPDKSNSKQFTAITSPPVAALSTQSVEKNMSPLNNVHRSILDFNRLLSPRRDTNDETILRTSTLKKKKKVPPTKSNKRNVRDLFGDDVPATDNKHSDELKAAVLTAQDSEPFSSTGRPSNEFNNAIFQSAISKDLEFTNVEEEEESMKENRPANKKIEQPFGPKEVSNSNEMVDTKVSCPNNSYQFIIDDYQLPQELIARNNKIRRCTWLSSDQVNNTQLQTRNEDALLPTLNESNDSSKKMNVNIKIVHKQLTPTKNTSRNDSMKSNCSTVSAMSAASSEDEFSVKSRIKFFRSLESQPVQRRTPNKSKMNMSRRSEMSFNEVRKAAEKAQRHTYPSSKQPTENLNQQLIKEITDITADIKNCLSQNKYLSEKKADQSQANENEINNLLNTNFSEADESIALLIDDLLNEKHLLDENAKNESLNEENEKRNSVRETVQKFESSLRNEKNDSSFSFQKIENKLLNEKIFNTNVKSDKRKTTEFFGNKLNEVTNEKIEDVIRFEVPSEVDNEAGAQYQAFEETGEPIAETGSQQSQTLIKRTFYQESIISGSNVEVPELQSLLANAPTVTSVTRKSSLTTRVTLNMRKCRRRSSDVGLIAQNSQNGDRAGDIIGSSNMAEVRHSICGSPLPFLMRNNSVDTTAAGRRLEQMTAEKLHMNQATGSRLSNDQLQSSVCSSVLTGIFNGKQIQSIEDLYIDDDFGGISLAANMKLMTNSTDSLDNINFDVIATHIFEQNSESLMTTTNNTLLNTNLNAIEQGEDKNDATAEE